MKLINTSALLFTGNISIAVLSLVLGIFTARYLGPESRGLLYLVIQVITIGSIIIAGGLGPAYQYYLSSGQFNRSEIFSHALLQTCLIAVIVCLLLTIGYPLFNLVGIENLVETFFYVIASGIIFNVIVIFVNSVLMTDPKGVLSLTVLNVGGSLANASLFVAFALLFAVNIDMALIAYFIGLLIRMIVGVYIAGHGISITISLQWQAMYRKLFKYGSASFLFNLSVVMVLRVDTFIVNNFVGLQELGQYAVAVTLAEMVLMLPSSIGTALFALFPTLDSKAQVELLKKTCRAVIAVTGVICIGLAVISPMLVTILMGEKYVDAIAPLRAMLPGLVALATAYVFANYFAGTGHPILGAGVFGLGLVVKVGLNYLLVPPLGILGAAIASSVAYIAIAFAFYVLLYRMQSVTAASLFIPTFEDMQVMAAHVKTFIKKR